MAQSLGHFRGETSHPVDPSPCIATWLQAAAHWPYLIGGVVDQVAELPALVALVGGEVVYEGHDGLLVGRQVQVAQQLLRVLVQVGGHREAELAVHGHLVGHAGVAVGGEVGNLEGHHGHGVHQDVLLSQQHGQHPRVVVPTDRRNVL
jgi:hypothetical protein